MPAPQSAVMKELAKEQLRTFAIKVPNQPPQMNVPATDPPPRSGGQSDYAAITTNCLFNLNSIGLT
jgi:hypothetical protein